MRWSLVATKSVNVGMVMFTMTLFGCWSGFGDNSISLKNSGAEIEKVDNSSAISQKKNISTAEQEIITLSNNLSVVIISDPYLSQGSASMDVAVGSLAEPIEYQGLAHYLEHMLFLGTEKYPNAGGYDKYLSLNQGSSNAYTAGENTNYHFDINSGAFEEGLDRFAQFFVAPLFNEQYIPREIKNVQSEYNKNIESDYWREQRVTNLLSAKGHPLRNFSIGNSSTLGGVPRSVLTNFHKKYYSANMMKLVVIGPQDVKTLKGWVKSYFSGIPNRGTVKLKYPAEVISKKDMPLLVRMRPIVDKKVLKLNFFLPEQKSNWKSKPVELLTNLLGDEQPGSILSKLKRKELATGVGIGIRPWSFGTKVTVEFELTQKGLDQWEEVTQVFFNYTSLIRKEGVSKEVLANAVGSSQLRYVFNFSPKSSSGAIDVADFMQQHPAEVAVERGLLIYEKDTKRFETVLSEIRPDKVVAMLISSDQPKGAQYDTYWKVPYGVQSLKDSKAIRRWSNNSDTSGLWLPGKNEFLPESVSDLVLQGKENEQPILAIDKKGIKIWKKTDHEFKIPKIVANITVFHKYIKKNENVRLAALAKLSSMAFSEYVNEWSYPGHTAGYAFYISSGVRTSNLIIEGYSDKYVDKATEYFSKIGSLVISDKEFERIKEKTENLLEENSKGQAYTHAVEGRKNLFNEHSVDERELLKIVKGVTKKELFSFIKEHYKDIYVTGLVFGNVTQSDVDRLLDSMVNSFSANLLDETEITRASEGVLALGSDLHYSRKTLVPNNAWFRIFQFSSPSSESGKAYTQLAAAVIDAPYYGEMRTKRSLGYIASSWSPWQQGSDLLSFIIQSDKKISEIDQINRDWFEKFVNGLGSMDSDLFAKYREALSDKILSPPVSFPKKLDKFTKQVQLYRNDGGYLQRVAGLIEKIELPQLQEFLRAGMLDESTKKTIGFFAIGRDEKEVLDLKSQEIFSEKDIESKITLPESLQ